MLCVCDVCDNDMTSPHLWSCSCYATQHQRVSPVLPVCMHDCAPPHEADDAGRVSTAIGPGLARARVRPGVPAHTPLIVRLHTQMALQPNQHHTRVRVCARAHTHACVRAQRRTTTQTCVW